MERTLPRDDCGYQYDYKPVHFLRCHSRNNDPADVGTQVWQCAFEPDLEDNKKTKDTFATCGGQSVCFVNANSGKVEKKYTASNPREMLYAIAWSSLFLAPGDSCPSNILVAGGVRGTLHIINPSQGVALLEQHVVRSSSISISSLLFHPKQNTVLFCGLSDGQVLVWDINYQVKLELLLTLEARSEIFGLAYAARYNMLLAACSSGLRGWNVSRTALQNKKDIPLLKFRFPDKDKGKQLVDSVEITTNCLVATKCALHGIIYIWDLGAVLESQSEQVVPTYTLNWSDTDNYFMGIGSHPGAGLLACGDDRGAVWLYDLNLLLEERKNRCMDPVAIFHWPELKDIYLDHKRKLSLDTYDIVVDKVAISSDTRYMVAVTSNNMICIWKRVSPSRN